MPTTTPINFFDFGAGAAFLKAAILIILIFYAIFALMVIRQVDLMSKTLVTKISPILKAFAIIHAGVAIGLIILGFGLL